MKKNNLIPLIVIVVPVTILVMTILYNTYVVLDVEIIPIEVNVNDNLGFNLDSSALIFGTIPPGNLGSRSIVVSNLKYSSSNVNIKVKGELKNWIYVSENNFNLNKEESKELEFKLLIPKDAEKRIYNSELRIITTRF
ncbi:MAG: hypothetical protein PHE43_04330 [Candidatus Nanoarchaeia archaeon]|nr:hypothetical protein [Candidatus Nanoarchaeia archaeon]